MRIRQSGKDDVGGSLHGGDELLMLMEGFLATMARNTGAIAGAVKIPSPDGTELQMICSFGLPPDASITESAVDHGCGVCGRSMREGEIATAAASSCRRNTDCNFFGENCKEVVAIPLDYRGKPLGIFNLFFDSPHGKINLSSFRSFGEILGIALENSRISRENRRHSMLTERQWMANEIHDSLAQTMIFARTRMSLLRKALASGNSELALKFASEVEEAIGCGQKNVRDLITQFRCQMDPDGLVQALTKLVDGFTEKTGVALEYDNHVAHLVMPVEHEMQVFNIVREMLSNVATHSGASRASLAVSKRGGNYVFAVEDNGSGFPNGPPCEGHYGLRIIEERAARLGGRIELESGEGLGTKVRLIFPHP